MPALQYTRRWTVNFLRAGRADVSDLFATKSLEKFADVRWRLGALGVPVLHADSLAYAECTTEQEIDGGDHMILIGRVTAGEPPPPESQPLMHFRRTYADTFTPAEARR